MLEFDEVVSSLKAVFPASIKQPRTNYGSFQIKRSGNLEAYILESADKKEQQ